MLRALVQEDRSRPLTLVAQKLHHDFIVMLSRIAALFSENRAAKLRRSAQKRSPLRAVSGGLDLGDEHDSLYQNLVKAWASTQETTHRALGGDEPGPVVSLAMVLPEEYMAEATLASLIAQSYSHWQLLLITPADATLPAALAADLRVMRIPLPLGADSGAALNAALQAATGDFFTLIDADVVLSSHALLTLVKAANAAPEVALIYADEDRITAEGRRQTPQFKPQWNRMLAYGTDYIGTPALWRTEAVRAAGGFRPGFEGAEGYDLLLRALPQIGDQAIRHLPQVLFSRRGQPRPAGAWHAMQSALTAHLALVEPQPVAVLKGVHPFTLDPQWPLTAEPLVSIIIPTRDMLPVLKQAFDSVLTKTSYRNFEVIIVDNNSEDPETLAWMAEISTAHKNVTVLRDPRPFNYSQLNNGAVEIAKGEFILLLNNDIEVISGEWLHELVALGLRPGTGCVGAKLLFPDTRVQHGGVIMGLGGVAGHSHKFYPRIAPGHQNRLSVVQEYLAVTAACLLVRKSVYLEVGGLNETELRVAFNDVDFCLKVAAAGYKNLWTPYAELFHHESISRGKDDNPEKKRRFQGEVDYMKKTWGTESIIDPSYNPNLSLQYEDFRPRDV